MKTNVVFSEPKYIVNKEKKTVVCLLKVEPEMSPRGTHYWDDSRWYSNKFNTDCMGKFQAKGVAKCSEDDEFNEQLGKRIAESKAKKQGFAIASQIMETVFDKLVKEVNQLGEWAFNCKKAYWHENEHINYLIKETKE